jgi:hypothetical protein
MRSPLFKTFFFFYLVGGALWLGGNVTRIFVIYDLYVPGTIELKASQSEDMRMHTIRLFAQSSSITGWGYALLALGGVVCTVLAAKHFRTRGWMVMMATLTVLIIGVGGYFAWDDYQLLNLFDRVTGTAYAQPRDILQIVTRRFTTVWMNMASGALMLAGITTIFYGAFRPLHRTTTDTQNNAS